MRASVGLLRLGDMGFLQAGPFLEALGCVGECRYGTTCVPGMWQSFASTSFDRVVRRGVFMVF